LSDWNELEADDLHNVGKLLQFGLRPEANPIAFPEYRQLLVRYNDNPNFRDAVKQTAGGLGINILEANTQGMILTPSEGSPFAMRWEDYPSHQSANERLINGLIFVAIITAVFPRAADLEESPRIVRRPVTTEEVEASLRTLCTALESDARGGSDIAIDTERSGLYEAWRVYHDWQSAASTPDGRKTARATRSLIDKAFEYLVQRGSFRRIKDGFQPTYAFNVMSQEFSCSALYRIVWDAVRTRENSGD